MPRFIDYSFGLVCPSFDSSLTELIIELEHLRKIKLEGTTPSAIFHQLREIFHLLESIGSARIEGNNTTLAEYVETKIDEEHGGPESWLEIHNIECAMAYIEDYIGSGYPINETFLKAIHQLVVHGLTKEGDSCVGAYREHNVRIANAKHLPPDSSLVPMYMQELFAFLEQDDPARFDLIKVALAHHRFVWIHPFGNGNGRTVRLFTYALLLKYGFGAEVSERIINPTAIFCSDRDLYYKYLSGADAGEEEGLLAWCEYVLSGLKVEIEKLNKLCDYGYVKQSILRPALAHSLDIHLLSPEEYAILSLAVEHGEIQNADLAEVLKFIPTSSISRKIRQLVEKKMLTPIAEGKRKYILRFDNSYLLRSIMSVLDQEGFLPMRYE